MSDKKDEQFIAKVCPELVSKDARNFVTAITNRQKQEQIKCLEDEIRQLKTELFLCERLHDIAIKERDLERMINSRLTGENRLDNKEQNSSEIEQLKQALTHVRHYMQAQGPNGVGIREFAAICGVSPTLISKWTSPPLSGVPDFID